MKITRLKIGISLTFLVLFSGLFCLVKFNIINIENFSIFSPNITQKIVQEGYLDEVWDFEKIPGEYGYYMWVVGVKAEENTAVKIASGATVTWVGNKELGMDYKSMEDYDQRNGHTAFINFIEKYENEHN